MGVIKAVKRINKIEMPSIPNLNFIKPLIQVFSSTNWKSYVVGSNEYHKNRARKKFVKLVKRDRYIEFLSLWFFSLLVKNIKNAPINGKKVIEDNIGKFIYK